MTMWPIGATWYSPAARPWVSVTAVAMLAPLRPVPGVPAALAAIRRGLGPEVGHRCRGLDVALPEDLQADRGVAVDDGDDRRPLLVGVDESHDAADGDVLIRHGY